jgi:hypothetical protein
MRIKQTLIVFALMIGLGGFFISPIVSAEDAPSSKAVSTSIIPCNDSKDGINCLLKLAINILTAGIGIAAVGGVVYGSILYTTAGGSAEQMKEAKQIIFNVVLGLVAYALMYSVLNYIIPGGLVIGV